MPTFIKVVVLILLSHLRQWPLRTLLTIVGVSLGVSASVAVRTANIDVLRSFEQAVLTVAGPTTLEVAGDDTGLDEQVVTSVRMVSGVISASPVIIQTAVRMHGNQPGQAIQVLGLDLLDELHARGFQVDQPETENQLMRMVDPQALFLGEALANEWQLVVGDDIDLLVGTGRLQFRVVGILHGESDRSSSWERMALMDIAAAQIAFGLVGKVDRLDIVTETNLSVEDVGERIKTVLPPHVTVERPANRTSQVEQMLGAFRMNLTVLSWVGLLVGMFLIYNTMAFAVAQRRREIGIYRAIGMSQPRIAVLFLMEAALYGVIGGVLGSAAGIALAHELITLLSRTISDLYVPVGIGGSGLLRTGFLGGIVIEGILIGCVVSMIGAIGPSLDASRTTPVKALAPGDYEASQQLRVGTLAFMGVVLLLGAGLLSWPGPIGGVPLLGYAATLCLLAGLACLAPICVSGRRRRRYMERERAVSGVMRGIAVEHAARNPGRNGVTVSAFMVGLAIMIGVLVMVRSFRHTVEVWVTDTVLADLVVAPSMWLRGTEIGTVGRSLPASWLGILASDPDVAAVDSYRDVRIEVNGQRVAVVSRDLRLHAQWSRYLVRSGDSSESLNHAAEIGGLLVSEVLANRLGVEEGSMLEVITPSGVRRFPIVAVFYDYSTDGGKLLMDRALYQSLWHDDLVTVFPVYLRDGTNLDGVRARMTALLSTLANGGLPPLVISNVELRKEILKIFDRTFLLTYVLEAIAVVIAMLGIVNTLITSVLERRREFSTLRAIGGSSTQIRQLVLWEAAYLGAVGIALGLIGGGVLSLLLIKVINRQSFGWTIQMIVPTGSLIQALLLAALATLVAGYFPARWAARQPIVEGLREE
ncbi:MAG: FtsX-like permease family protein [Nitrospira sp.]|nr:FtsX-like permease family protein [Nitrospira sp.]MDH4355654.1 FtsX-like permease family protein [Nitrospira sp.]MDH5316886.1 FtsX-like permease family protein [Nitrospira sp.]